MPALHFSFIDDPSLLEEISKIGDYLKFKSGDIIVKPEKYTRVIPLVLEGTIKVMRMDQSGNEFLLYYITKGQSCAVSLSSCITGKLSNIKAVALDNTELIAIPASLSAKWFNDFPNWRIFVLKTMDSRFEEMIKTVDSFVFLKADDRLLSYLQEKSQVLQSNIITITHQEIAHDLSTTREMISRLLKGFEKKGLLKIYRNKIEIISAMC